MKKLLYIVFIFNFLFSLLTAILPLLVYEISGNAITSGYVLGTFMVALLCTRIFLLKVYFKETVLLKVGLSLYCLGFSLLILDASSLFLYFLGAAVLGISVGIISPLLITIISSRSGNTKLQVGLHNSFMGVGSAIAPFFGLFLYYQMDEMMYLYLILFLISLTIAIPGFLIKEDATEIKFKSRIKSIDKSVFSKEYVVNYLSFLLISVSYGSIIAFLPILFGEMNLRIDIFYFFFWVSFLIAQVYMIKISDYLSEIFLLPISVFLIALSTFLLGATTNYVLLLFNALVFGFFYGGVMNLFYNRIAKVEDTTSKTDTFSIFGLMSFLGVALGSILLGSIANKSLEYVFYAAAIFPICALIVYILFPYLAATKSKVSLKGSNTNGE